MGMWLLVLTQAFISNHEPLAEMTHKSAVSGATLPIVGVQLQCVRIVMETGLACLPLTKPSEPTADL